jgi:hypothetical protein
VAPGVGPEFKPQYCKKKKKKKKMEKGGFNCSPLFQKACSGAKQLIWN